MPGKGISMLIAAASHALPDVLGIGLIGLVFHGLCVLAGKKDN